MENKKIKISYEPLDFKIEFLLCRKAAEVNFLNVHNNRFFVHKKFIFIVCYV